jgi:hypothetical protein
VRALRDLRGCRAAVGPVFADGHHRLKRLAWAAFPRRLPAGPGRGPGGSTRRITPA